MSTEDLIARLGHELQPVEPLPRPSRRAVVWFAGAVAYVAVLAVLASRGGVAARALDPGLLVPNLAALAASALAALAAFMSVVPGRSRQAAVWAAVAALVWAGTLAAGALSDSVSAPILAARHEWVCVAQIVLGGLPLVAVLARMLRRGAVFDRTLTAALLALAVGTLANAGACVSHAHPDDALTLVWHGGAVLALALACVATARYLLRPEKYVERVPAR